MRCEVIAIGTELLLGQNIDTNSAWIGEQLALAGIDSYYQTHVGDNLARIVSALRIALDRNEAVIVCGGLGPTHDDITREAIAELIGAPLVRDDSLVKHIRELFVSRGREMPANNLRQADVPQGAAIIPQMLGTAPGLICPVGDKIIYSVPGVPHEMQEMIAGTVIPDLQKRAGNVAVIKSRTLRTWGQSESGLAELLASRIAELDKIGNPTLALLASGIEGIKVRITAKAQDYATAQCILEEEDARLRAMLGDLVFGIDQQTMESVVIGQLCERKLTLAAVESITGGLMSARLTTAPYANEVLRGSIVLGACEPQSYLLGLSALPSEPEAAARDMALIACRTFQADVGLAATCAMDVDGSSVRVNAVFLAIAVDGLTHCKLVHLPGDRERVRQFVVINLLNMLRLHLTDDDGV